MNAHAASTPATSRRATAVLTHLLGLYPAPLSIEEVVRELTAPSPELDDWEATEDAIRELIAAGLLHRNGEFVFPTRAARRFDELRRTASDTSVSHVIPSRSE